MKEKFNIIQTFHDESLVGLTGEDFVGIKLLYRDLFVTTLDELLESSFNNKKFCLLYERFLEAIGEMILPSKRKGSAKKGLDSLLIQVDVLKENLHYETYFVENSRVMGTKLGEPQFNPWGYNKRIFYPKKDSTAFNLIQFLMNEVNIKENQILKVIKKLREIIPDSTGNCVSPIKIYKVKRSTKEIKEILRYIFFKSIQGVRLSRCGENVNRLVFFHKCSGTRIVNITKYFTKLTNDLPFKLFYLDRSKALTDVITEIKLLSQKNDDYKSNSLNNIDIKSHHFWKNAKIELNLTKLAEIFQKAELDNISSLNMDYSIDRALKNKNAEISTEITHFWNENFSDSFTRLVTIMIGDSSVRRKINEKTNILLYPYVDTLEVGHAHGSNLITKPDVLCFKISSKGKVGRALESVQIKKLSKIGQNRGELNTIDYITDILKTFTFWEKNQIPKTLRRLQIYAIRQGDRCNNRTIVAEDVNVIIIAFWGSSSVEVIRINDLIAAIRLENYTKILKCRNRKIHDLAPAVYKRMNEGTNVLNGTKKAILPLSRVIELVDKFGTNKTIYSFLFDTLFYILETFHESFRA
jgi:hypothetical protein